MNKQKFDILDMWVDFHRIVDIIGRKNFQDVDEEERAIGILRGRIVDFIVTVSLDLFEDNEYSDFVLAYDIARKKLPELDYDEFLLAWVFDIPRLKSSILEKLDVFLTKLG